MNENMRSLAAAAVIMLGFGLFAYFLPKIMLAAIEVSPWAAGAVGAVFLLAFFGVFWLRSRFKK